MKCIICKDNIKVHELSGWSEGHNAEPVKSGRCCDDCNDDVVMGVRFHFALNPNTHTTIEELTKTLLISSTRRRKTTFRKQIGDI